MKVLPNATRMRMKSPKSLRNTNRRKGRTAGTCIPPREDALRNTRRKVWRNWLTEENYF